MRHGKVTLMGAGPGDPELLTVKAARALASAQAVVYDRLVSEGVLALIPPGIPRFFAGKSCKQKAMTQDEINELLVTLAQKGLNVVRLKGGDPFLFGRGGEEALALAERAIAFEIIPGITSAQGCGAAAGIPLTHRGLATGVRFITGHREFSSPLRGEAGRGAFDEQSSDKSPLPNPPPTGEGMELNWQSLADPDTTLVVYMGLANLAAISDNLIAHGLAAETPAAAIRQGTTPEQQIVISTLSALPEAVKKAQLESPVLVIIGRVVELSHVLQWLNSEVPEQAKDSA